MEPNFFRTAATMQNVSRQRSRRFVQAVVSLVVVGLLATALWAVLRDPHKKTAAGPGATPSPQMLAGNEGAAPASPVAIPRRGGSTTTQPGGVSRVGPQPANATVSADRRRELAARLAEAEVKFAAKDYLAARGLFNACVDQGLDARDNAKCVARLASLADEMIFSTIHVPNDPLTELFQVPAGAVLNVIGKRYKVTADLLEKVNHIKATELKAGQSIKCINGPFDAVVDKSDLTLSAYLNQPGEGGHAAVPVLVRRFRVGLGENNTTPTGEWRITNRQAFPPYVHPRTGKKIDKDDPAYPFGHLGLWMAIKGVAGAAVGQQHFGIHSTNEPDSIGKQSSLGCIRTGDADIQEVWILLRAGDDGSRIFVQE